MNKKKKLNKLDEAIKHCEAVAKKCNINNECKEEHLQLAKWLKELKRFRSIIVGKLEAYSVIREEAIDFIGRNLTSEDKDDDLSFKAYIVETTKDTLRESEIKIKMLDDILEFANENYESTHQISDIFNT